jgi:trigger factor
VKVNEVRVEEKPELNDDFAKDTSEFDTFEELKADIRSKLEKAAEERSENDKKNAVLDALLAANEFDAPITMVEDQMDQMMNEFNNSLRQQGLDMNTYFQYLGQDPGEFRESVRESAVKRVKIRLLVKNVARMEDYSASDEELAMELEQMANQYGFSVDQLKDYLGEDQMDMVKEDIRNRKAVNYMYEMAVVTPADDADEAK